MKRLLLFMAALILIATTALAVMGQTRPQTVAPRPTPTPSPRPAATPVASNAAVPESRIALIDTGMFGDEKNGIFRYVDAAKSVELEFRTRTTELQTLQNRLNTLVTEIQTLRRLSVVDQKAVQAKQAEGERLQQEFNTKKERLDEDITRRYQQVVAPVSQQIGAAMDQFA
jgi:Skp family chaperone for outer membrane proteins